MKRKGTIWITLGLLLIAVSLFITVYNLQEAKKAGIEAEEVLKNMNIDQIGSLESEIPDYMLNPDMEMPAETVEGNTYIGILKLPTLGLKLPVMSEWSYPGLKIAPCRYKGSAYTDDLIIAAHNYPTHFGTLKNLQIGDPVTFTDVDGNRFDYEVAELETLMPSAIEEMTEGDWDLTLFTCTIGGQSRVTVRCVLTNS